MFLLKCVNDVGELRKKGFFPEEFLKKLAEDLRILHEWYDEDKEFPFEEFHADILECGYVAVLEAEQYENELELLGVSGGVEALFPETVEKYIWAGEGWLRMNVIYNDSFGMIFWIAECHCQKLLDRLKAIGF